MIESEIEIENCAVLCNPAAGDSRQREVRVEIGFEEVEEAEEEGEDENLQIGPEADAAFSRNATSGPEKTTKLRRRPKRCKKTRK